MRREHLPSPLLLLLLLLLLLVLLVLLLLLLVLLLLLLILLLILLLLLLLLPVEADYVQLAFFQESFPAGTEVERDAGEGLQEFEGEAVFHVDWAQRTTSWRLPDFSTFTTFQTAVALGSLSVVKHNLEFFMAHSNRTRVSLETLGLFPSGAVRLRGCELLARTFGTFPLEVVSEGVEETSFLPNADNTFHKFSYLPFVPADRDLYTCRVEHWGLEGPLTQTWGNPRGLPGPFPETAENVLCSLGLAIGILGIIVGTVLFFKAMRMTYRNSRGGQSGGL
uniref:Ig-like domain-containing protein n=1 Tax=Anolis carolinensis TaxID=28377 RepID=A0A803SSL3_ANOCA